MVVYATGRRRHQLQVCGWTQAYRGSSSQKEAGVSTCPDQKLIVMLRDMFVVWASYNRHMHITPAKMAARPR
jgi:hypothetical protein